MAEFETGQPGVRQIQTYIKDQQPVEVKLLTGDVMVGKVRWQDANCLYLYDVEPEAVSMIVWRHAIAYVKA